MSFSNKFKKATLAASVAMASLVACGTASAAGFMLTEQSVVGLGRSHAGAGIVGDDLSAVHYNVAGMTLLPGTQVQVAATYVALDIDFKGAGSLAGVTENGRDKPSVIPAMFLTHQVNEQLWVGLGITSPYGMKIRYGENWPGNSRGISASIITTDINPNIAWKVNDMLSIGAGISALYAHAKLKSGLGSSLIPGGSFEFKGSDWMWTYNLGLMFSPAETLRFGLSYRSAAHVRATGDYSVRGSLLGVYDISNTIDGTGTLTTPETVYITGTWKATDRIRLSALARWANWKNFDDLIFRADDASQLNPYGLSSVTLTNDWKSVWLFSLGADIKINDQWTIRGGIGLETDPIHNQQYRTALIPDTKRLWLTCGFSWTPTKNWQFDAAYGHIRGIGHRDFYNSTNGVYEKAGKFDTMNAWLAGISATYRF